MHNKLVLAMDPDESDVSPIKIDRARNCEISCVPNIIENKFIKKSSTTK